VAQDFGKAADALHFMHDQPSVCDNLLSRRGGRDQASAIPYEQLHPELFLEQSQLLADAGLRGIQVIRRIRNVQAVIRHTQEISELL
jgi:hypothetical protein